jgi:hypothetical protein
VRSYRSSYRGRRYKLVDTLGFDDSRVSNATVTTIIVDWFESSYREGACLNGMVYVHNISKPWMQGSALQNIRMFRKLYGNDSLGNIVLATSFWVQVAARTGLQRERELIESSDFWARIGGEGL